MGLQDRATNNTSPSSHRSCRPHSVVCRGKLFPKARSFLLASQPHHRPEATMLRAPHKVRWSWVSPSRQHCAALLRTDLGRTIWRTFCENPTSKADPFGRSSHVASYATRRFSCVAPITYPGSTGGVHRRVLRAAMRASLQNDGPPTIVQSNFSRMVLNWNKDVWSRLPQSSAIQSNLYLTARARETCIRSLPTCPVETLVHRNLHDGYRLPFAAQ